MSEADWLERLNSATQYRDLQLAFASLASQARMTTNGPQLAASIDEAIRRIEQERIRDEGELHSIEDKFREFRDQQSGVVGWFKRHIPFTETRRQQIQHQEDVADQRAEILADNLVIARAQMLKEQLLPADSRRLGLEPADWRRRLNENESPSGLQAYATVVRELGSELQQSQTFTQALQSDIEAFAKASFSDAEDRQRQASDLTSARNELAVLQSEIQNEQGLRVEALKRLGELVNEELSAHDPSFRELQQRTALLEVAARRAKDAEKLVDEQHVAILQLCTLAGELAELPVKRRQLDGQAHELRNELAEAEGSKTYAAASVAERAVRLKQAEAALAQAKSTASSIDHKKSAAQPDSQAEVSDESAFEGFSAATGGDEPARRAVEKAEAEVEVMRAPHELARKQLADAEQRVSNCKRQLDKMLQQEKDLSKQQQELQNTLQSLHANVRGAHERLEPIMSALISSLEPVRDQFLLPTVFGQTRYRLRFGFPQTPELHGSGGLEVVRDIYAELLQAAKTDRKSLKQTLAEERKKHLGRWNDRCRELCGSDLAREICE